jgi:addiction module HigA family antidote
MTMDGFIVKPQSVGDHLREDFLPEFGLKAPTFAKRLGVDRQRVVRLLKVARCDADMALRLAQFFGTSAEFWMNLQARYELETARLAAGSRIEMEVEPVDAA